MKKKSFGLSLILISAVLASCGPNSSDVSSTTSNSSDDTSLTSQYLESHELTVAIDEVINTSQEDLGIVEVNGTATLVQNFKEHQKIKVEATVLNPEIAIFLGWFDEVDKLLSTELIYEFEMGTKDRVIEARFTETYKKGDVISYGTYPQARVTDPEILEELNNDIDGLPTIEDTKTWTSYDCYQGINVPGVEGIVEDNSVDYMWYKDINLIDKGLFRGVYFTSYRPMNTNGVSNEEKSLQDNRGYLKDNVYWFKYEPISWTVLNDEGMLFSKTILDIKEFYRNAKKHQVGDTLLNANNYEASDIRKWLNDDFIENSFSDTEFLYVDKTLVKNDLSTTLDETNDFVCNDTYDFVYLMSEKDITNKEFGFNVDADRTSKVSEYAKCMGAYINVESENGRYWTRSPDNKYSYRVTSIDNNGKTSYWQTYGVAHGGVRPVINLKAFQV